MRTCKRTCVSWAAVLALLAMPPAAGATVFFTDSFDTSVNSYDVNFEAATRQGGTVGTVAYVEGTNTAGQSTAAGGAIDHMTQVNEPNNPNKLYLFAPHYTTSRTLGAGLAVGLDHSFMGPTEGSGMSISFDMEPGAPGSDPNVPGGYWGAISFGAPAPFQDGVQAHNCMALQVFVDGEVKLYWKASAVAVEATLPTGGAHSFRIDLETPGHDSLAGNITFVKVYADGATDPFIVYDISTCPTMYACQTGNYITFMSGAAYVDHVVTFDNFEVSTLYVAEAEIPEPATMALLGLGGLAVLRRRRR